MDPEGRHLEFQAFLHPLSEVNSRPSDWKLSGNIHNFITPCSSN
jgi:hypothetical protein